MSSGGKGGGSNTTNEYHGTIAGACGEGPATSLCWIIAGGKVVFDGPLDRPIGADYSDIDLVGMGKARWYWGTETQVADPELSKYAVQPGYRGWVYLVLIDCSWGSNGETNTPTVEIGWRRSSGQLVVTGSSSAIDGNATANPITVASEILTSWNWAALPTSRLNVPTFQATADSFNAETVAGTNRIVSSIAPLWNEQVDLRTALADIAAISKAWLRIGVDGKIEAGRWLRSGTPTATALTYDDVDSAEFTVQDTKELSNSFLIEFRDSTKHHKQNCITRDNLAAIRAPGAILKRTTATRMMLTTQEQAIAHATDLLRDSAAPLRSVKLVLRRHKAVNPDGSPIRPGDYFMFDIAEQGDPADVRLFRCVRREFEPTGPITISGELETNGSVHYVPPITVAASPVLTTPPLHWVRVMSIPTLLSDDLPCVTVFAARPSDMTFGMDVQYCASPTGDFGSLGSTGSFALPLSLAQALASGDGTIRLKLLPDGSNGESARRDQTMLLNWNGGATEAGIDTLLLCVIAKDGGGHVTGYEFLSVAGPASAVATDTYDVPVLRGRRGTSAQNFNSGSFPDAWTNYEVWCIPKAGLDMYIHPDLASDELTSSPAYFEFITYGQGGSYDPASSWTERQRRAAASLPLLEYAGQPDGTTISPQVSYVMPLLQSPNSLTATVGTGKSVALNWIFSTVKSFSGEYGVYRATGPGYTDWAKIAEVSGTRFVDNEVTIGTTYKYKIVAITPGEVSSPYSNIVTATPSVVDASSLDPAVLAEITAAQAAADAAQADADAANTSLANIASDNILSPVEKPQVILDYNVITSEQSGIDTKATLYGITTEKTTYDNAVSALTTYLGTLTTPTAWNNTAGDTTIVGTTFRSKFSDVYAARQALLNKINDHFGIPSNPTAPTFNTNGTYVAADGTTFSRIVINVPAMPNGAAVMNVLYRRTGTTGWIVGDQRSAGGSTSSIDDLTPGQQYDIAVQAFSNFGIASSIITATGSPFTAPVKSSLPNNASSFAAHAPSSSWPVPAQYYAGVQAYGATVTFTPSTDPDVDKYEYLGWIDLTTPSAATNGIVIPRNPPQFFYYTLNLLAQFLCVRTWDRSGNKSAWYNTGINMNGYVSLAAGTMSVQNSNAVNMSGVQVGQSGGSITKVLAIYESGGIVVNLAGGTSETFAVSLSGCGFTTKPDVGTVQCIDPAGDVDAFYDQSNASNSSTQAIIKVQKAGGYSGGYRRFSVTFKQTF
jgi:hypothetical protein